jgi:hypothetical protein
MKISLWFWEEPYAIMGSYMEEMYTRGNLWLYAAYRRV